VRPPGKSAWPPEAHPGRIPYTARKRQQEQEEKMGFVGWIMTGIAIGLIIGVLMKVFGKKK
jgi:hypothetical protein